MIPPLIYGAVGAGLMLAFLCAFEAFIPGKFTQTWEQVTRRRVGRRNRVRRLAEELGIARPGRDLNPVPCLICGKDLEHVGPKDLTNHPGEGLAFDTGGHYGSALFDPGRSGIKLEIAVHDSCLNERRSRIRVVSYQHHTTMTVESTDRELGMLTNE